MPGCVTTAAACGVFGTNGCLLMSANLGIGIGISCFSLNTQILLYYLETAILVGLTLCLVALQLQLVVEYLVLMAAY
jgi:hypothetical protein